MTHPQCPLERPQLFSFLNPVSSFEDAALIKASSPALSEALEGASSFTAAANPAENLNGITASMRPRFFGGLFGTAFLFGLGMAAQNGDELPPLLRYSLEAVLNTYTEQKMGEFLFNLDPRCYSAVAHYLRQRVVNESRYRGAATRSLGRIVPLLPDAEKLECAYFFTQKLKTENPRGQMFIFYALRSVIPALPEAERSRFTERTAEMLGSENLLTVSFALLALEKIIPSLPLQERTRFAEYIALQRGVLGDKLFSLLPAEEGLRIRQYLQDREAPDHAGARVSSAEEAFFPLTLERETSQTESGVHQNPIRGDDAPDLSFGEEFDLFDLEFEP